VRRKVTAATGNLLTMKLENS